MLPQILGLGSAAGWLWVVLPLSAVTLPPLQTLLFLGGYKILKSLSGTVNICRGFALSLLRS